MVDSRSSNAMSIYEAKVDILEANIGCKCKNCLTTSCGVDVYHFYSAVRNFYSLVKSVGADSKKRCPPTSIMHGSMATNKKKLTNALKRQEYKCRFSVTIVSRNSGRSCEFSAKNKFY